MNPTNHYTAFLKKVLAHRGAYERRAAPDLNQLGATIDGIATAFETYKTNAEAKMARMARELEMAETRRNRPGAMHDTRGAPGLVLDDPSIEMPTAAERKAFSELLRTGDRKHAVEARASVNVGTSGQGLEAVAPWFDTTIRMMARAQSPMLRMVGGRRADNFPVRHVLGDPSGMGSGWAGEQAGRSDSDPAMPRVVEVAPGEWFALPSVTEWALADIFFDVEAWLRQELIREYAESLQNAIVGGNGLSKPTGFLAGPTPVTTDDGLRAFGTLRYHPTGVAATLPTTTGAMIDLLLDVVHGLKSTHRRNAAWTMNATTMSTLRKFKDADGRPILLDSLITGQPMQLLGYPVAEVEDMPAIGANAFPIAFGDFQAGYVLDEDANGIRITRDEITSKGFVKFYARCRAGGKIMDSQAIRLIKVSVS